MFGKNQRFICLENFILAIYITDFQYFTNHVFLHGFASNNARLHNNSARAYYCRI